jgi:peroxiredoxin Q/BCP
MLHCLKRFPQMRLLDLALTAAGFALAATTHLSSAGDLKPGDPAPPFSLLGSDGVTYRLADYTGRQAVVLAWFPKAFTSG